MEKEKDKRKKYEIILIAVCLFAYITSQLGRHSYNSTKTLFIDLFGVSHEAAGLPTTLFFFAYGLGQVVFAPLYAKLNSRITVPVALSISAAANFAVFFGMDFGYVKYAWLINGAAQALLWPTFILTLTRNIAAKRMPLCAFLMSTASTGGMFLAYGVSSLFAIDPEIFLWTFFSGAAMMLAGAVLWFFTVSGRKGEEESEKTEEDAIESAEEKTEEKKSSFFALLPLIITLACFAEFAAASYAIGGGITQWFPAILKENYGLNDAVSILVTVFIPLFSVPNAVVAGWLYSKTKDFVVCSALLFALGTVLLFLTVPALGGSAAIVVALFIITNLAIGVISNQMAVQAPLLLKGRINSGFLAGLLNGCCYIGSAVSTYVLGVVADNSGWATAFVVLAVMSGVSAALAIIFLLVTRIKKRAAHIGS